jgi:hypothetical protein
MYLSPANVGAQEGGRRSGPTVKALKRTLKKAGLKTTGKKATLTRRVKKAHLKVGGGLMDDLKAKLKEKARNVMDKVTGPAPAAPPAAPAAPATTGARRR